MGRGEGGGEETQSKNLSVEGVWIFSEKTNFYILYQFHYLITIDTCTPVRLFFFS